MDSPNKKAFLMSKRILLETGDGRQNRLRNESQTDREYHISWIRDTLTNPSEEYRAQLFSVISKWFAKKTEEEPSHLSDLIRNYSSLTVHNEILAERASGLDWYYVAKYL